MTSFKYDPYPDILCPVKKIVVSKFQILLKVPMLLELKGGDKTESRILVFTVHRLFVVTSKVPARIDHHFHYLGKRVVARGNKPLAIILEYS